MNEHREFIGTYENMGLDVWSVDDQIADTSNEVVRCKNCAHRHAVLLSGKERYFCLNMRGLLDDNDFCSKGVKEWREKRQSCDS